MSANLDLEDVAATSPKAQEELTAIKARIKELEAERDGYRNGQEQMQHINFGLIDSNNKLAEDNKRLRGGLEKICNPIAYLKKQAEMEGATIIGEFALRLANDPNYLRDIARKALEGK